MSNNRVRAPSELTLMAVETLIVWTMKQTTDMALSFQEGQGCSEIMFVRYIFQSDLL